MTQYLHGTSDSEQQRLALLNQVLNDHCLREIGPEAGDHVLDVGAGTGILATAIARAVGAGGRVVAIEQESRQVAQAERNSRGAGLDIRLGDALAMPLGEREWGSFDIAHTRFLLEHLPNPQGVVDKMVEAVRPGGRIVLMDDDHSLMRFWPPMEGISALWDELAKRIDTHGGDAHVGRKLVHLLQRAGADPGRTTLIPYAACHGSPLFPTVVENLVEVIRGAAAFLVQSTWSQERIERELLAFRRWSEQASASVWYAIPLAVGCKPLSPPTPKA